MSVLNSSLGGVYIVLLRGPVRYLAAARAYLCATVSTEEAITLTCLLLLMLAAFATLAFVAL